MLQPSLYPVAPQEPRLVVTGGFITREVTLIVMSADYIGGTSSVAEMKVWGDIDPNYRSEIMATTEGAARWIPYQPTVDAIVSVGNGAKDLSVKLRNQSGVETEAIETTVDLTAPPHPSVIWSDGRRMAHDGGKVRFVWSPSHAVDEWEVLLAPYLDAERSECRGLASGGSVVAGGSVLVGIDTSTIEGLDFYPQQNGRKWLMIFMRIGSEWYGRTVNL